MTLFVDATVARRLEAVCAWHNVTYAEAYGRLHPGAKSVSEPVAGGYAVYVAPGSPANRAAGLGLNGPVTAGDLDRVEDFYRRRDFLPRVELCPLADESLIGLLRERGYRVDDFYSTLWMPISAGEAAPPNPDVEISRMTPADADLWLRTVGQGFSGQDDPPPDMGDVLGPNFYSPAATNFLARIDGEPAGGGSLVAYEGAIELCSASTRPQFRRRGVQTALIRARLIAAGEMGSDLAMVLTSPGSDSQRNLERFGFRLAYTKAIMIGQ